MPQKPDLSSGVQSVAKATSHRLKRIYRAKLRKLCDLRYGNHYLPDNADGRAMLVALLSLGMTDESAISDAHWCEAELPLLKRRAARMNWRNAGKLIRLSFDEWKDVNVKAWVLRPIDRSEAQLEKWRNDRCKAQDSARKKRKREQERSERETARATNDRCEAVLMMLGEHIAFPRKPGVNPPRPYAPWTYQDWVPVSRLIELAPQSEAFRRPDGKPLRHLRKTIHRTLKQLAEIGVVEIRLGQGQRGKITLIRKAIIVGKVERDSVASAFPQKTQKTRGFSAEPTLSAGKADTVAPMVSNQMPSPTVVPFKRRKVR